MVLDLRPLFREETKKTEFDYEFSLADLDFYGLHPVTKPVSARGQVTCSAGVVSLRADVRLTYEAPCDRCAADTVREMSFSFGHILVSELGNEDTEDFVLVEEMRLELDELLRTDIILSLPTKFLCKPDCKGLCPRCGVNRNLQECDCDLRVTDPRLEALKQLL